MAVISQCSATLICGHFLLFFSFFFFPLLADRVQLARRVWPKVGPSDPHTLPPKERGPGKARHGVRPSWQLNGRGGSRWWNGQVEPPQCPIQNAYGHATMWFQDGVNRPRPRVQYG